jgi:hypothetical protein
VITTPRPTPSSANWLRSKAATAVEGGDPAVEQEALAAVRALGLAGRSEALHDVTGALIDRATLGEEQGFGGLSRLRTIFALAVLEAGVDVPELEGWIERSGREPRVGGELWGLAVRTAPSLWVEPVIDAARSGDREALVGVESLTGVEQRAAVLDLATGPQATPTPSRSWSASWPSPAPSATSSWRKHSTPGDGRPDPKRRWSTRSCSRPRSKRGAQVASRS